MDLFDSRIMPQHKPINILSRDGIAHYYGKIIRGEMVSFYFQSVLQQVQTTKIALPWLSELITLKALVENTANETFNSCLLNFYHSGIDGMGWHSDDESELKKIVPLPLSI